MQNPPEYCVVLLCHLPLSTNKKTLFLPSSIPLFFPLPFRLASFCERWSYLWQRDDTELRESPSNCAGELRSKDKYCWLQCFLPAACCSCCCTKRCWGSWQPAELKEIWMQKENTHATNFSAQHALQGSPFSPWVLLLLSTAQSPVDRACFMLKVIMPISKNSRKRKARSVLQSVVLQLTTQHYADWAGAGTQSQHPAGKITSPWTCCHFCPPGS